MRGLGRTRGPKLAAPIAGIVGLSVLATLLAGSGPIGPYFVVAGSAYPSGPTQINLLPSTGTGSACISQKPGAPYAALPLVNGTLQTNLYNPPANTSGSVGLCYRAGSGSLYSYVNWKYVGGKGGWFSYPQLAYGVNEYAGDSTTYTNQSPAWVLPQPLSVAVNESLWVTAGYTFHAPPSSGADAYDLSFDDYLSEGLPPTFEQGPFIEVLILLDHHLISHPAGWSPWKTETLLNSTVKVEPWYVGFWCHGPSNTTNSSLTFDFSYGGPGNTTVGLAKGTLGVNVSAILSEVAALVPQASCWTGTPSALSNFYLDQEVYGAEEGALAKSSFHFNWTTTRYCFHTDVGVPSARSVGCSETTHGGASGSAVTGETPPSAVFLARPRR
jgi:hypothetical protein